MNHPYPSLVNYHPVQVNLIVKQSKPLEAKRYWNWGPLNIFEILIKSLKFVRIIIKPQNLMQTITVALKTY